MQKVVAEGMENPARGRTSTVRHGSVSSKPLTVEQADQLMQDPKQYFDSLRPNVVSEAAAAGLQGAAVGAVFCAGAAAGTALWSKGTLTKDDAGRALEAGAVGAAAGTTSGVVATLLGSSAAGGLAGGAVVTGIAIAKAKNSEERLRRGITGAAGVVAGMAGACASSAALAAVGLAASPAVTLPVSVAAYAYADGTARKLVEPHCEAVGAAAWKGAQALGALAGKGRDSVGTLVAGGVGAAAAAARSGYQGAGAVAGKAAEVGIPVAKSAMGGVAGVFHRASALTGRAGRANQSGTEDAGSTPMSKLWRGGLPKNADANGSLH